MARDHRWKICKTSKEEGVYKRKSIETRRYVGTKTNGEGKGVQNAAVKMQEEEERKGIAGSLAWVEGYSRVAVPYLLRWPRHLAAKHTCPTPRSNSLTTIPDLVPLSCKPRGGIVASSLGYCYEARKSGKLVEQI